MKRTLAFLTTTLLMGSASAATAIESYITPQNKLVVAGLKPGKLYGVLATTPRNGIGVKNFTSNACGEVIIDRASNFQTVTIDRQKLIVKSLAVKARTECTKTLPPNTKPKPMP